MKSRDRRAVDFIRIIFSFSSSPDSSTKNVRICDKCVKMMSRWGSLEVKQFCLLVLMCFVCLNTPCLPNAQEHYTVEKSHRSELNVSTL